MNVNEMDSRFMSDVDDDRGGRQGGGSGTRERDGKAVS